MLSSRRFCLFISKIRQHQLGHNWTQGVSLNQHHQIHLHYPEVNMFKDAPQNQAQTGQSNHQSVITSVERPTISLPSPRLNSPPPIATNTATTTTTIGTKQKINNFNAQLARNDQSSETTDAVIISQIQQLQSPRPQSTPRDTESPISQATKSRHRGFLSQLLCCFRPASSIVYQDPRNYENSGDNIQQKNRDIPQHHSSQKYSGTYLLPARKPSDNRICLVIDLDETLVHSSFKPIDNADFIVPVEIDGTLHKVYVLKRPHVDVFLKRMGQLYECVLFTASLAKYADPVADLLDAGNIFKARLFRESCAFYRGNYVKDLSRLGRDLDRVIIVDNSPASYIFHPDNAVSIYPTFFVESEIEMHPNHELQYSVRIIANLDQVKLMLMSSFF